jgi:histone H3/H4
VIHDAVIYMEEAKRRTLSAMDVVNALKRRGSVLYYGYGGEVEEGRL